MAGRGWCVTALPQQHRFSFALWTLGLIRELIERCFDLRLSRSVLGRAMHLLVLYLTTPALGAGECDGVLVGRWERDTFPAIAAEAKRVGARIFFVDQAGMRSHHHPDTTWTALGRTPSVTVTGQRFATNMPSAVNTQGRFHFMVQQGRVDAEVFIAFLDGLLKDTAATLFRAVDDHSHPQGT